MTVERDAFLSAACGAPKPMKFQDIGYAPPIDRVSDIDIAGTCLSLKPRTGPPGRAPAAPEMTSRSER